MVIRFFFMRYSSSRSFTQLQRCYCYCSRPHFVNWIPASDKLLTLRMSKWGQGESAGQYRGHRVTERGHWWPEVGSSYSLGAVDADYSLSPPKTVCVVKSHILRMVTLLRRTQRI